MSFFKHFIAHQSKFFFSYYNKLFHQNVSRTHQSIGITLVYIATYLIADRCDRPSCKNFRKIKVTKLDSNLICFKKASLYHFAY